MSLLVNPMSSAWICRLVVVVVTPPLLHQLVIVPIMMQDLHPYQVTCHHPHMLQIPVLQMTPVLQDRLMEVTMPTEEPNQPMVTMPTIILNLPMDQREMLQIKAALIKAVASKVNTLATAMVASLSATWVLGFDNPVVLVKFVPHLMAALYVLLLHKPPIISTLPWTADICCTLINPL